MAELTPYVPVVWIMVMVGVFPSFATPRRAVLFILFCGMLFLPEAIAGEVALGPIHFNKYHAISYAMLFGILLYESGRLSSGMPRWYDIPMLIWCLCPIPSGLSNDAPPDGSSSVRDALAQTWSQIVTWGIPYLMGRVYFCDRDGIRDLALGTVIAAAVYAPFCLYENRMSPQLHRMVYGYAQHAFGQSVRLGGYRPVVFLTHGLAVAMFMVSGALIAVWMWRTGTSQLTGKTSPGMGKYLGRLSILLVPTAILTKSTGAIILGVVGGCGLWLGRATNSRMWLLLLAALPPTYAIVRATGMWSGQEMVDSAGENIETDRAQSLEFRLKNENILIYKALARPVWGWGGWGRNRVFNEKGQDISTTDGLWIIVLGTRGIVGLIVVDLVLLLPIVRFVIKFPPENWSARSIAPAVACAFVLVLWTIDSLFNAMLQPIYLLMSGAIMGLNLSEFREFGEPK